MASNEQPFRTSLRIGGGAERRWWNEDFDVKPAKAEQYGGKWTEDEIRHVVLNPTLTFDDLAQDLGRSPGSINALRNVIRAVGGATANTGGWVSETSHRAQLVRKVLDDLGFSDWTDEDRRRYLVRGRGRRSDHTQRAELIRRGLDGQKKSRKVVE
jgi:hypothetical protein